MGSKVPNGDPYTHTQPPNPLNGAIPQAFSAISSTLASLSSTQVFSVLEYHVGQVLVTVPFTSGTLPTRLMGQSLQLVAPG